MARGKGARGRRLPKAIARALWDRLVDVAGEDRTQPLLACRDQAILALFLFSGVRSAELVGLDVEDLDLEGGTVRVRHGKGNKERVPAVGAFALDLLEAWLDVRPECEVIERGERRQPLFVSRKKGRLSTSGIRRLVGRIEAVLQVEGVDLGPAKCHAHAFRHSHVQEVVNQAEEKGINIFEVAEQAGHADLRTTRLYYASNAAKRRGLVDGM